MSASQIGNKTSCVKALAQKLNLSNLLYMSRVILWQMTKAYLWYIMYKIKKTLLLHALKDVHGISCMNFNLREDSDFDLKQC